MSRSNTSSSNKETTEEASSSQIAVANRTSRLSAGMSFDEEEVFEEISMSSSVIEKTVNGHKDKKKEL